MFRRTQTYKVRGRNGTGRQRSLNFALETTCHYNLHLAVHVAPSVDKVVAAACAFKSYSRLKPFFAPFLENRHKWHLVQSRPSLQPCLLRTYLHGNWQHNGWPCEPIDGHHCLLGAHSGDGDLARNADGDLARNAAVLFLSSREKESPLGISVRTHCSMASA